MGTEVELESIHKQIEALTVGLREMTQDECTGILEGLNKTGQVQLAEYVEKFIERKFK